MLTAFENYKILVNLYQTLISEGILGNGGYFINPNTKPLLTKEIGVCQSSEDSFLNVANFKRFAKALTYSQNTSKIQGCLRCHLIKLINFTDNILSCRVTNSRSTVMI